MLTFIDDYSRHCWVFFLATKNETFASFKQFRKTVEKQIQKPVSCLRTDRGGEFLSTEFNNYCKLEGIRRQLTAAGTPQQKGIAERKN
jgi:transposase InsO family protein